jgi:hypothetical protein
MFSDVHDLTGDKTMHATSCVRLANDDLCSVRSTGGTAALIADNGACETAAYRRPHAPRSGKPKNAALTGLRFDISSTSELRSATHRSRVSDCARSSPRLLGPVRASYRPRIGDSPTDHVSQTRRPIWSRGGTEHPSRSLPGLSADSYIRYQLVAYCGPNPTRLRSERRVVSPQTKSIPGPIPRAVYRVAFTALQLAPTMTHVSKQLTASAKDCSAHQISRNKS